MVDTTTCNVNSEALPKKAHVSVMEVRSMLNSVPLIVIALADAARKSQNSRNVKKTDHKRTT